MGAVLRGFVARISESLGPRQAAPARAQPEAEPLIGVDRREFSYQITRDGEAKTN